MELVKAFDQRNVKQIDFGCVDKASFTDRMIHELRQISMDIKIKVGSEVAFSNVVAFITHSTVPITKILFD